MSKFYGQVFGAAKTVATRRGHSQIITSAQSFDGSVITRLYYKNGELMVNIELAPESSCVGLTAFNGTFAEYAKKLQG